MKQHTTVTTTIALLITLLLSINTSDARIGAVGPLTRYLTSCYPEVRKVKIDSTTGEQIQIFELQVYSSDNVNVALNKTASQSSTFETNLASFAVDGDMTTFSHTDDAKASWEVDLGSTFSLKSVMITNRWCGESSDPNACLCRLSGAMLTFLNEEGEVVSTESIGDTCGVHDVNFDMSACPPTKANNDVATHGGKSGRRKRPSSC